MPLAREVRTEAGVPEQLRQHGNTLGGEPVFVFEQEGETLTGTYKGTFGTADVTGTVTGNQIEFRFGGEGAEAVYVGTLDSDTMRGTCDYGGVGEGTWEANRQP